MVGETPRIVLPAAPATAKIHCPDTAVATGRMTYAFGHWAFVLVLHGNGTIAHAGHRHAIGPGSLICSPPGLVTVDLSADAHIRVLTLEERGAAPFEAWKPFAVPLVRHLPPHEVEAWSLRLATAEHRVLTNSLSDVDVRALKSSFLDSFWLDPRPSAQRLVHDAFVTLSDELHRIEKLDDVAAGLGYTRNHLSDVVRDLTGASLGAWLIGMRMARAREELMFAETPIADVGARIGYGDAAYFSRAFRRYHGVPPHVWRLAHRPDDERRATVVMEAEDLADDAVAVA